MHLLSTTREYSSQSVFPWKNHMTLQKLLGRIKSLKSSIGKQGKRKDVHKLMTKQLWHQYNPWPECVKTHNKRYFEHFSIYLTNHIIKCTFLQYGVEQTQTSTGQLWKQALWPAKGNLNNTKKKKKNSTFLHNKRIKTSRSCTILLDLYRNT